MSEAVIVALICNGFATLGLIIKACLDNKAKKKGLDIKELVRALEKAVQQGEPILNKCNPHAPGESPICKGNKEWLGKIDDKLDKQGEKISGLEQCLKDVKRRLDRLEKTE